MLAPFILGHSGDPAALCSNLVIDGVVGTASAIKGCIPDKTMWEYWTADFMKVLAIASPFVLGFTFVTAALQVSIIQGIIVTILSGYKVYSMNRNQTMM